jgi:hypothetical protein
MEICYEYSGYSDGTGNLVWLLSALNLVVVPVNFNFPKVNNSEKGLLYIIVQPYFMTLQETWV